MQTTHPAFLFWCFLSQYPLVADPPAVAEPISGKASPHQANRLRSPYQAGDSEAERFELPPNWPKRSKTICGSWMRLNSGSGCVRRGHPGARVTTGTFKFTD